MDYISLVLIALSLCGDSFAVSVSSGLLMQCYKKRNILKIAVFLAFFQGIMPLIGWIAGKELEKFISDYDHWVAFFLLIALGLKMIYESYQLGENKSSADIMKLKVIVGMAIATSIDALVVGITFALANINIYLAVLIISFVTFFVSMLGILFGKKLGALFGKRMETIGGLILISIGFKILLTA